MAYNIDDSTNIDNNHTEGFALLQYVVNAEDELLFAGWNYPELVQESQTHPIIVKFFSDGKSFVKALLDRLYPKEGKVHQKVSKILVDAFIDRVNRIVNNKAGMKVIVEVHWVSAHTGDIEAHDDADTIAGEARDKNITFATCNGISKSPIPSVWEQLRPKINAL